MDWKQKLEQNLHQGYDVTRKLFGKAKERAAELGEHGVLSLEVRQLEAKYTELLTSLGGKVHNLLVHEKRSTVTAKSQGVKELLEQIEETREELESKRQLLQEQEKTKSGGAEEATDTQETAHRGSAGQSAEETNAEAHQAETTGEEFGAEKSSSNSEREEENRTDSGNTENTEHR